MRKSKMYRIENLLNAITHKMYVTKFWFSSKWKLHIFLTPGTQFSCFWKIVHFSTLFAKTLQNKSLNMLRNRFLSHGINNFSFWAYVGKEKYKNDFFSKSGKIVRFYIEISRMANFSPEKADFVFLTFFPCSLVNFEQEKLYYKPNNHTLKNDKNWPGWDKTLHGR